MVIKGNKIFHSKAFQNVPKLGVWYENKPSGNPATIVGLASAKEVDSFKTGADFMITIFCDFRQFWAKNGVFLKNANVMIPFLQKLTEV
jgi:hypothetical protein